MKNLPQKLSPQNIQLFKSYRLNRTLCKLRQYVYEFMIADDFIKNICRSIELNYLSQMYSLTQDDLSFLVSKIIEELKTNGWEACIGLQNTMLFIYPPNEQPKLLKYSFEEF